MNGVVKWTIPVDHPAFAGHFPGRAILPGVLLLDAALNAILAGCEISLVGVEISATKFLSPATPGDELCIQYARAATGSIRFDIAAGTRKIANGSIIVKSTQCSPQ